MRWSLLVMVCLAVGCGGDEPEFVSVLLPEDTHDTIGPYRVETRVYAPNGVHLLVLRLQQQADSEVFGEIAFEAIEETHDRGTFAVDLPGRPAGSVFRYYLLLVDGARKGGGALVRYPESAPQTLESFSILLEEGE